VHDRGAIDESVGSGVEIIAERLDRRPISHASFASPLEVSQHRWRHAHSLGS
jgi:hypothetical protein